MQYRSILEDTFQKGFITVEDRITVGEKRRELGVALEEAKTLQIMVLGAPIGEITSEPNPGNATPTYQGVPVSNAGTGIFGGIVVAVLIVGVLALVISFPPSWPVIALLAIVGLIKGLLD